MDSFLQARGWSVWDSPPPPPKGPDHNYPTLLFSWWCTGCAAFIIVSRLVGRKIRSNMLFREDWIMMAALIPLVIRQALIHVVLLYRTNNVQTVGYHFSALDIEHRSIGSRLVIAARLFYALFIWTSKLTVSEFLKRTTVLTWRRSYELTLRGIRVFLFISFGAVVIATLTECQPFDHFWQVVPDPGPHCRTGYANLISMGACDIITDLLLIGFPIPIVLRSGQTWKRKLQLASLFSLSIIMIGVTATRIPQVLLHRGRQQYRTVWASCEILASAAVSNAVILGSFLRDKGTKRNRYRSHSHTDSIERSSVRRTPTVTGALPNSASEEDLFRSLGIRIPEHLQGSSEPTARPAPMAILGVVPAQNASEMPSQPTKRDRRSEESDSEDSLQKHNTATSPTPPPAAPSPRRDTNFFDVGGLLDDRGPRSCATTLVGSSHSTTAAHDFAGARPSTPVHSPQSRRGSRAFLQDMGGLFAQPSMPPRTGAFPAPDLNRAQSDSHVLSLQRQHGRHGAVSPPTGVLGPMLERRETQQSLQDAGNLLGEIPEAIPLSTLPSRQPSPHPTRSSTPQADILRQTVSASETGV